MFVKTILKATSPVRSQIRAGRGGKGAISGDTCLLMREDYTDPLSPSSPSWCRSHQTCLADVGQ
jgi:hypothetical protein